MREPAWPQGKAPRVHDIDDIIASILSDPRIRDSRAFQSDRTYSDEPILRRGSQMRGFVPQEIRDLRELGRSREAYTWTRERRFFEGARLMEGYSDTVVSRARFHRYYPTYDDMTDDELRGYFSWRARARAGEVDPSQTSFVFVNAYELIQGVGGTPEECLGQLRRLFDSARGSSSEVERYLPQWMVDLAAIRELDPSLVSDLVVDEPRRKAASLAQAERDFMATLPEGRRKRPEHEFCKDRELELQATLVMGELSTYSVTKSRLFKDDPDAFCAIAYAVFCRMCIYYRSHPKPFVESLFGSPRVVRHTPFSGAVYYRDPMEAPGPDRTYEVRPEYVLTLRQGTWWLDSRTRKIERSTRLGSILRAVDRKARVALGHPNPLQERKTPKYLEKIIDEEIAGYLAWREAHTPRRIDIDLSQLAGIRSAAALTRESLLVDEEREDPPAPTGPVEPAAEPWARPVATPESGQKPEVPQAPVPTAPAPTPMVTAAPEQADDALPLTAEQAAYLRSLVQGEPLPRETSADLMVDQINEALFDEIGDTALEFDDTGSPRPVENYVDDLREMLGL